MTRSLYSKFILGYLIFGLLSVLSIATLSSHMVRTHLEKTQAEILYDEANAIAASCSSMYQGRYQDYTAFSAQLNSLSSYLRAEIWVADRQGVIVMDSQNGTRLQTQIPDFDPTFMGAHSYVLGNYHGLFNEVVLSVAAPVTGNYTTYGYVTDSSSDR